MSIAQIAFVVAGVSGALSSMLWHSTRDRKIDFRSFAAGAVCVFGLAYLALFPIPSQQPTTTAVRAQGEIIETSFTPEQVRIMDANHQNYLARTE